VLSHSPDERLRILQLLSQHEEWLGTLKAGLAAEVDGEELYHREGYGKYAGWEWYQVHTPRPTLDKMLTERLLDITLHTRSGTSYRVKNPDLIKDVIHALEQPTGDPPPTGIPDDLFSPIVGHDNIKSITRYAIESDKAVHLLFSGPPASAKTLFLMELARLPESYYAIAQTTSQAGLANLLFTYQPRFLLIDEIDRLTGEHVGVLNSLMATGIISESKFHKTRSMELKTKVFAAGIRIHLLPKDLMSRFTQLKFNAYTEEEFIEVSVQVLSTSESVDNNLGAEIARSIWQKNHDSSDVRNCVQIARLGGGDPVKTREVLKVLRRN